jgi:hypothetical protein
MNITYLFGAGASCNCLPTYANFYNRFNSFLEFIHKQSESNGTKEIKVESLRSAIEIVMKEFLFHNTPDTIAKKYFHLGDDEMLNRLKNTLTVFFLYEQSLGSANNEEKHLIDKRYDSFIAALLKPIPKKIELLENINILTWNYDLQFEICFSKYMDQYIHEVQDYVQSFPKIEKDEGNNYQENAFSLIHLNGIAFPKPHREADIERMGSFYEPTFAFAIYLSEVYEHLILKRASNKLLKFAWENMNPDYSLKSSHILDKALAIAEKTQVLVINGYSFPGFNREIDKELFNKMYGVKTIYIQSPQANDIENIIKSDLIEEGSTPPIFKNVGYWNQFFIPSEWSKVPDAFVGDIVTR